MPPVYIPSGMPPPACYGRHLYRVCTKPQLTLFAQLANPYLRPIRNFFALLAKRPHEPSDKQVPAVDQHEE
jgi:hypothetical protein